MFILSFRMKFSILTVSDSCFADNSLDKCGPSLIQFIKSSQKIPETEVINYSIVADEKLEIESYLKAYSNVADVLLTIGGTGLSKRDVTPEATKTVIERECSGISTAIVVAGLKSTPFAALSRLVAGTRGNCLIVNLPGSPRAVSESFQVLEEILDHAVSLIQDKTQRVKKFHDENNANQ